MRKSFDSSVLILSILGKIFRINKETRQDGEQAPQCRHVGRRGHAGMFPMAADLSIDK